MKQSLVVGILSVLETLRGVECVYYWQWVVHVEGTLAVMPLILRLVCMSTSLLFPRSTTSPEMVEEICPQYRMAHFCDYKDPAELLSYSPKLRPSDLIVEPLATLSENLSVGDCLSCLGGGIALTAARVTR